MHIYIYANDTLAGILFRILVNNKAWFVPWIVQLRLNIGNHRLKSSPRRGITFVSPPLSFYMKITVNDLTYIWHCCVVWHNILNHMIQNCMIFIIYVNHTILIQCLSELYYKIRTILHPIKYCVIWYIIWYLHYNTVIYIMIQWYCVAYDIVSRYDICII